MNADLSRDLFVLPTRADVLEEVRRQAEAKETNLDLPPCVPACSPG
jgi:hypothetical protein